MRDHAWDPFHIPLPYEGEWRCTRCGVRITSRLIPSSTFDDDLGIPCVTYTIWNDSDLEYLCKIPADCDLITVREVMLS